jgi:REP element-mobilizing transposase RayT
MVAMARPLRIEYPGAMYHVTSRGNKKCPVFEDDEDRVAFLDVLHSCVERYGWICHGYCLMGNHYHLLIETPQANLSIGMRQLNGVYTQRFNRAHESVGHLFQGRFKALLVQKESYLLELCRYIVLNPVRSGMVDDPGKWPWSSYLATAGRVRRPPFLDVDWIRSQFHRDWQRAVPAYERFVLSGMRKGECPWEKVRGRVMLGSEDFIHEIGERLDAVRDIKEIPKVERLPARPPLTALFPVKGNREARNRGIVSSHMVHGYTLKEIADHLGVHYSTVGRVLRKMQK